MAAHNLTYITGSTVGPFLTGKDPEKLIKGNYSACVGIAAERLAQAGVCEVDPDFDGFGGNKYTEYGQQFEADAITAYENSRFVMVTGQQVPIVHPELPYACTPDGLVGASGLIEVKVTCKLQDWVSPTLVADRLADYGDQIQFNLWLSGRSWCDLVLYMPRFRHPYDLMVHRVQVDPVWVEFAEKRLPRCLAEIDRIESYFKTQFLGGAAGITKA